MDGLTRLIESLRGVATARFNASQSPIWTSHCHQTYGRMLSEAGRWDEAEVELRRAVEVSVCAGHRASAMAGLADLRIHQNRTAEAVVLLRGWEDRLGTAPAQAKLHDARGDLGATAAARRRRRGRACPSSNGSAPAAMPIVPRHCSARLG